MIEVAHLNDEETSALSFLFGRFERRQVEEIAWVDHFLSVVQEVSLGQRRVLVKRVLDSAVSGVFSMGIFRLRNSATSDRNLKIDRKRVSQIKRRPQADDVACTQHCELGCDLMEHLFSFSNGLQIQARNGDGYLRQSTSPLTVM